MNIQPNPAAASIAGVSHAAARGGEQDKQSAEAIRQQKTAEAPGGKSKDSSAIDAGDRAGDRDADGRQTYDHFEKSQPPNDETAQASEETQHQTESTQIPPDHIDFQA